MSVPLLEMDVLETVEFPANFDRRAVLYPLRHPAWRLRNAHGMAKRIALCHDDPLNFALTYLLPYFADQLTGRISFSPMHMDLLHDIWLTGQPNPQPRRRAEVGPRESGKSTQRLLVMLLWLFATQRQHTVALFSFTAKQIFNDHLRRLREILDGQSPCSELLLSDYPWLKPASRGGDRLVLADGATIICNGLGSNVVGMVAGTERPGIILGDDLLPATRTNTDEDGNVDQIREAILNTVLPLGSRAQVILCGTVWKRGDLMDDVVRIAEGRPAVGRDRGRWLTGSGFSCHYWRPDWPQRWSYDYLQAELAGNPHAFALKFAPHLLDQVEQEAYFTAKTWHRDVMFPTVRRIISIDHAVSSGRKSDHTAIAMLGGNQHLGGPLGRVGVEHVEAHRGMSIDGILRRVHELHAMPTRHKPDTLLWERNQGGEMLASRLAPLPTGMRLETWHANTFSKAARIEDLLGDCVAGKVQLVGDANGALAKFEEQAESWSPRSTKDDMLDTVGAGKRKLLTARAEYAE